MAVTNPTSLTRSTVQILRFDAVQRVAHWVNSLMYTVLILTGIPLYFGSFFGVVLERHTVQEIHLWTGLFLPLPLIVSLAGPWGRRMRRDVKRFNYWTRDEFRWLRTFARARVSLEKYNPGQKLNAIFISATIPLMLITGAMLQWFRFFSISQREGATFVHDSFAFAITVVIVGHIYMAITHRGSLRSMVDGHVSEEWASQHAPLWLDEVTHGTE